MRRRALGGLGVATVMALLALGLLPQAAHALPPRIRLDSPAAGTLSSPVTISGQALMDADGQGGDADVVDSVTLTLSSSKPIPPSKPFTGNGSGTLSYSWAPALLYNGAYTVEVAALGRECFVVCGEQERSTVSRAFSLAVPPAAPTGVKAVVDQTKRTITLSWNANPEPDTFAYGVYRKNSETGEFEALKFLAADKRTYTDSLGSLPADTYEYQVIAGRTGATDSADDVVVSSPAAVSAKVTSAPPTTTTTTAGAGGGSGSTTTTAKSSSSSSLASRGRTDHSGFAALLPSGSNRLPSAPPAAEVDPGFEQELPFDSSRTEEKPAPAPDRDDEQALGETLPASSNDERPTSLLFMAAGLLATVVLMHLLWLRDEVNKEPLPVLATDEPETA